MIFLTILRADVRGGWNMVRRGGTPRRRVVALAVLSVTIGPPFLAAVFSIGAELAHLGLDAATVFAASFTAIAVLVLVLSLSGVISAFFGDRSLLLLALAPVPASHVFAARLITASFPAWVPSTFFYAELAGYGAAKGAALEYYVLAALAVAMIVWAAVSVQVVMLALALRLAPVDRARDVANLLAGLLGTAVYLGWFLLSGRSRNIVSHGAQQLAGAGSQVLLLPTAWPARALAALASHDLAGSVAWFSATALFASGLVALAWLSYRQAFLVGVGIYSEGGARLGRRLYRMRGTSRGPADPVGALCRKDLRALRRDVGRLGGVLPSAAVAVVYPLLLARSHTGAPSGQAGFWLEMLGSLFAPFLLSNVLALPAVALEGRGIQLLLLAGTSPWVVLRAKLAYAIPSVAVLGAAGALVVAALTGGSLDRLLLAAGVALWFSAGLAGIAVGAGAIAPNFKASNPRRAVRMEGSVVALLSEMVFIVLSAAGLGLILASSTLPPTLGVLTTILGPVLAVAAAGIVGLVLALGARSLRRLSLSPASS